jgi:hypothetical protein
MERPILFSGPMVRAILEGRKTQTRRIIKPRPPYKAAVKALAGIDYGLMADLPVDHPSARPDYWRVVGPVWAVRDVLGMDIHGSPEWKCPYGHAGDRLWVKEKWQAIHVYIDPETGYGDDMEYAKSTEDVFRHPTHWSIVYAASDPQADYTKEDRGFPWRPSIHLPRFASRIVLEIDRIVAQPLQEMTEDDVKAEGVGSMDEFVALWESIHGPKSWEVDPWVWAIHSHPKVIVRVDGTRPLVLNL